MALCPACGSSHIRNDYKPAPLILRIFFVRALLCDHCNHQFKVFSFAGMPPRPQRHTDGKTAAHSPPPAARAVDLTRLKDGGKQSESTVQQDQPDSQMRRDLRTEIARLHAEEEKDQRRLKGPDREQPRVAAGLACPHCGSTNVNRRRRTVLERLVFSFTKHKAFSCRFCRETFYSKVEDDGNQGDSIDAAGTAP